MLEGFFITASLLTLFYFVYMEITD
ncbi:hypothetical protein BA81_03980 [Bacillus safensis FO-36b]|nr:hypothetical protein BA1_09476 [Bacillus xiamenensis]KDE29620.1 hypothetical protein BA81_03980 [Bacillus safensis FO-36b]KDE30437.1 hypothetical protein BA79_13695 [Bacillus altitudinis 41KF2b]